MKIYKRTGLVLSAAILSILAFGPATLFGQDIASVKQAAAVDLTQAGDSPLRLTRMPSTNTATIAVRVENVGQAPIVSYVIAGQGGYSVTNVLNEWLMPGSSVSQTLDASADVTAYAVDYVRFAGGSSWGSDTLHRSATVDAKLAGRQAAIDRLRELVSLRDNNALDRFFEADPSDVNTAAGANRPERWQREYQTGYRSLVLWIARYRAQGEDAFRAKLASLQ